MPSPVAELLRDLASSLDGLAIEWYVFGAQAAIVHGAARLTADVDVTVLLPAALSPHSLVDALHQFEPRFADTNFLERARVIPIAHTASGIPVDLVLGGPGLEEGFAARARRRNVEGVDLPVASAEDIVVMKVLAARPKDLEDVAAVLSAQQASFDATYARRILVALEQALGQSDLLPVFERLWCATGRE
jgi:hypothetical protein